MYSNFTITEGVLFYGGDFFITYNVHATIPKGNMGYDQYTVPDIVAVEPTFATFLWHSLT